MQVAYLCSFLLFLYSGDTFSDIISTFPSKLATNAAARLSNSREPPLAIAPCLIKKLHSFNGTYVFYFFEIYISAVCKYEQYTRFYYVE